MDALRMGESVKRRVGGVHWRLKTDEMEGCVGGRGGNINENEGGGRQEL